MSGLLGAVIIYNNSMNTTYILAGGNDRSIPDYGTRLAAEITKRIVQPKILSSFLAWPESTWGNKAEYRGDWFRHYLGDDIRYDYARRETFLQQIDDADVVHLHGGTTQMMFDTFPTPAEFTAHLDDKIVVGSSAGANVLAGS